MTYTALHLRTSELHYKNSQFHYHEKHNHCYCGRKQNSFEASARYVAAIFICCTGVLFILKKKIMFSMLAHVLLPTSKTIDANMNSNRCNSVVKEMFTSPCLNIFTDADLTLK